MQDITPRGFAVIMRCYCTHMNANEREAYSSGAGQAVIYMVIYSRKDAKAAKKKHNAISCK